MVETKTILLKVGDEAVGVTCRVSYDEHHNLENVNIIRLVTNNVAEQDGVDISGLKADLVIEARIKQLVENLLNQEHEI